MYLNKAKNRFTEMFQELKFNDKAQPCTVKHLRYLEQQLGLPLPAAYQEFLLWMGGGAGRFMDSHDFAVGYVLDNRRDAIEVMEADNCPEPLPNDAIVFSMSGQGYHFMFIRAYEGDDPPIHEYVEGKGINWNLFRNLEDFLLKYIAALIKSYKKSGNL